MTIAITVASLVGLLGTVAGLVLAFDTGQLLLGVLLTVLGGSLIVVTVGMLLAHLGVATEPRDD